MAHRPAATLSNVKGKRDAPSPPANVTCLHSTQTNRSEPTMCVSGMPGAQSCKCSCEVTFSQPKHSFVIMVRTPFWNSGEVRMPVLGPDQCALIAREDISGIVVLGLASVAQVGQRRSGEHLIGKLNRPLPGIEMPALDALAFRVSAACEMRKLTHCASGLWAGS